MEAFNLNYSTQVQSGVLDLKAAFLELDELIQNEFVIPTFVDFWYNIDSKYQAMNFKDSLSDKERINEYKYVYEQYLKYIFKNQDTILNGEKNYKRMLREAEELRKRTSDSATERKKLVYQSLRNEWLDNLIYYLKDINNVVNQHKGGDDE